MKTVENVKGPIFVAFWLFWKLDVRANKNYYKHNNPLPYWFYNLIGW